MSKEKREKEELRQKDPKRFSIRIGDELEQQQLQKADELKRQLQDNIMSAAMYDVVRKIRGEKIRECRIDDVLEFRQSATGDIGIEEIEIEVSISQKFLEKLFDRGLHHMRVSPTNRQVSWIFRLSKPEWHMKRMEWDIRRILSEGGE